MIDLQEIHPTKETRFIVCECKGHAIAVTQYPDAPEVYVEMWEPRGGQTDLRWRIRQAWRVLWGRGAYEEAVLSKANARYLGEHLISVTEDSK